MSKSGQGQNGSEVSYKLIALGEFPSAESECLKVRGHGSSSWNLQCLVLSPLSLGHTRVQPMFVKMKEEESPAGCEGGPIRDCFAEELDLDGY